MCCAAGGSAADRENRINTIAASLLAKISPEGAKLARTTVLAVKDTAHYGTTFLTEAMRKAALRSASRVVEAAESRTRIAAVP
jgi:hypothetical protein